MMSLFCALRRKPELPEATSALPGRTEEVGTAESHFVFARPLKGPFPAATETIFVGMGCFWGAERMFWQLDNIVMTAVGYGAGFTPNPTYQEVCSGQTGHNELVRIDYRAGDLPLILKTFWEGHDPTQGMRQGNDRGTQYRSGIYFQSPEQHAAAIASRDAFQGGLDASGYGKITSEILPMEVFYYAEDYHQQYLAKNPGGYCGIGGTGVSCPIGLFEPTS
jgi:peptide-methionine (S)-S-oxide reductase